MNKPEVLDQVKEEKSTARKENILDQSSKDNFKAKEEDLKIKQQSNFHNIRGLELLNDTLNEYSVKKTSLRAKEETKGKMTYLKGRNFRGKKFSRNLIPRFWPYFAKLNSAKLANITQSRN